MPNCDILSFLSFPPLSLPVIEKLGHERVSGLNKGIFLFEHADFLLVRILLFELRIVTQICCQQCMSMLTRIQSLTSWNNKLLKMRNTHTHTKQKQIILTLYRTWSRKRLTRSLEVGCSWKENSSTSMVLPTRCTIKLSGWWLFHGDFISRFMVAAVATTSTSEEDSMFWYQRRPRRRKLKQQITTTTASAMNHHHHHQR